VIMLAAHSMSSLITRRSCSRYSKGPILNWTPKVPTIPEQGMGPGTYDIDRQSDNRPREGADCMGMATWSMQLLLEVHSWICGCHKAADPT
jgi:hypothetical protein